MAGTRDISMVPHFIEIFILPFLFLISFVFNVIVLFVASEIGKLKAKLPKMIVPMLVHTLIVGVLELASINAIQIITSQWYQLLDFAYAAIALYAALSFAEIFLTFKFVTAKMMKMKEGDVCKYAVVMGIATNPLVALLALQLVLYLLSPTPVLLLQLP